MANTDPPQAIQSLLGKSDPNNLHYSTSGPDEDLSFDTLNEMESLLDDIVGSLPEDKYDDFHNSLESIRADLYGERIMKLAEFDFSNHEQAIWEENNPSEEEMVAAASEAATSVAIDKLNELVDLASEDLESIKSNIDNFVASTMDA